MISLKGKKPTNLKRYPLKTRLVFYFCLTILLWIMTLSGMVDAFNKFPIMIVPYMVIFVVLLILSILLFFLIIINRDRKQYGNLKCILEKSKYKQLCYQLGLYVFSVDNSEDIIFPNYRTTSDGFEIESLPGLTEKLLDAVDDFNGILYRNHTGLVIEECYLRSGWVYYRVSKDFRKERI